MRSLDEKKIPILVVGGAGYIGSHVCLSLENAGFLPITYDNLETGHASSVLWGPLEVGDTRDSAQLEKVLIRYKPQAVIHLAASLSVGESVKDPAKYYDNNIVGSMKLLDTCLKYDLRQFIFSSTAAVYGLSEHELIDENHPTNPINPYGYTKLVIEQMLKDYEKAYGLSYVALRYFNAAGADGQARIGCKQISCTNLIPLLMEVLSHKRKEIEVFGSDYPTADGTAIRDYIHVSDLALAHVLALQYLLKGGTSDTFNLGTGKGHSVLEVIEAIEKVSGHKIPMRLVGRRAGDPIKLVASNEKAKKLLGWNADSSDLDTIAQTAWKFQQTQKG